ncbi:hypothetical protein IIA79_03970, partial [bacterium]|nr:hypothetical protein [bacterium]
MLRNVFLKSLWEQRRSLLWWSLALAALTLNGQLVRGMDPPDILVASVKHQHQYEGKRLDEVAEILGTSATNATTRARQLVEERRELETLLDELRSAGGAGETVVLEEDISIDGSTTKYKGVRLRARNADDVRKWGDAFLTGAGS